MKNIVHYDQAGERCYCPLKKETPCKDCVLLSGFGICMRLEEGEKGEWVTEDISRGYYHPLQETEVPIHQ